MMKLNPGQVSEAGNIEINCEVAPMLNAIVWLTQTIFVLFPKDHRAEDMIRRLKAVGNAHTKRKTATGFRRDIERS